MPAVKDPPIGTITPYAGPIDLAWEKTNGWAVCDGRSVPRTGIGPNGEKFAGLFDAIGSSWGGDGVNNFNLPDLQGLFLRGVDGAAGRDPDKGSRTAIKPGGHDKNQVGSFQASENKSHSHGVTDPGHSHGIYWNTYISAEGGVYERSSMSGGEARPRTTTDSSRVSVDADPQPPAGKESRPINAYVYWIIRYK